jgi:hypothetical protein
MAGQAIYEYDPHHRTSAEVGEGAKPDNGADDRGGTIHRASPRTRSWPTWRPPSPGW